MYMAWAVLVVRSKHLLARVNQLISGRTDLSKQGRAGGEMSGEAAGVVGGAEGGNGGSETSPTPAAPGRLKDGGSRVVVGGEEDAGEGGGGNRVKKLSRAWLKRALDFGFSCTDREVMNEGWLDGSTSVVMAVTSRYIMVANAGDSRAVLMDGDKAVALSNDHKPSRPDEMKRIEKAGGFVMHLGVPRVNGVLAVSRALGDAELKPFVPSQPEYRTVARTPSQRFAALATDGVWDVMSNQEVMDMISDAWLEEGHGAQRVALEAFNRGSFDNICILVLDLSPTAPGIPPLCPPSPDDTASEFEDGDAVLV